MGLLPSRIIVFAILLIAPSPHVHRANALAIAAERPVGEVMEFIGKRAGVVALVDSTIVQERGPLPSPDADITAANVDQHIRALLRALPEGATCVKLNLPPLPAGKSWDGDRVVALARAQAQLYGKIGALGEPGEIEVFSKRLAGATAKQVETALDLRPVYVLTMARGTFTGTWNATYGELRLRVTAGRVRGEYTTNQGEITGTVRGDIMSFRWFEHGTQTGGHGEFRLSEDGRSFTGIWWNDGGSAESPSTWSGTRISYR